MNKSEISFGRVIRVCLMIVILMLAGCSSKPIPSAAATATHEATATSTATLKPTSTVVQITATLVEGAVVTDQGSVFVENGKYMLIDAKGIKKEIKDVSTEIIFNNAEDASKADLALHAKEYANQTRADFLPGKLSDIQAYAKAVDKVSYQGQLNKGTMIPLLGTVDEIMKVKYPLESNVYDSMSLMMVRVLNNSAPIPVVLGISGNDGTFYSFYDKSSQASIDVPREQKNQSLESLPWITLQGSLKGNIVYMTPFCELAQESSTILDDESGSYDAGSISPTAVQERSRLLQLVVELAKYGYKVDSLPDYKLGNVGSVYSEARQLYQGDGKEPYFFIDGNSVLYVNVVK